MENEETKIKRCVCQYDCPDSCGLLAEIKDGKIIKIKADPDHPHTKGFICRKAQGYERMINDPGRILYPMKRASKKGEGIFERISWEQALDLISKSWKEIIADYGPQAILPYSYAGTEGLLQKNCGIAFFNYMGASKLKRTICSSGKGAGFKAVMGDSLAMPTWRVSESDYVIIWGSNIAATRLHDIPYVQEAKKKGAKIILIDVYESPARVYADECVLINPAADGALALAMIHVMEEKRLLDHSFITEYVEGYEAFAEKLPQYTPEWAEKITGIKAEKIRELAMAYGLAERPAILLGSGPSRQKNGAMNTRAIMALVAVSGSLKKGFGLCGLSHSDKWGRGDVITRPDFDRQGARSVNMMQLASALSISEKDDRIPVKSLYVYNCNPLLVSTNQEKIREGLEREDLFTVVHERFMTDTAKYADIVLPALFSPEEYDIYTPYGYNEIQYGKKIVEAPGEGKSNWETFCLLAKKMGFEDPYFDRTEEEMCLQYLDRECGQLATLDEEAWAGLLEGKGTEILLSGKLDIRTKSGKILFYNPEVEFPLIEYLPEDYLAKGACKKTYPLHLVAAPSLYTLNSTFTNQEKLVKKRGPMTLMISKEDARARGIEDGDPLLCFNELAKVAFYAQVTDLVKEGCVVAEGVFMLSQSVNGKTVNALFGEELSDLGEATTMNSNYVEIKKASGKGLDLSKDF